MITEAWKKAHPDRRAAQVQLANALRKGLVKPWPICAVPDCCRKPEAHHPDYSRPLDVVWLCRPHHMQVHAMAKRADHELTMNHTKEAR